MSEIKIIQKSLDIAQNIFPEIYDTSKNRNWHFACAFRRNTPVAIGLNDMITETHTVHKFSQKFGIRQEYKYKHAELDAIRKMWGKIHIDHKIKFVIVRLNKFKKLGDSKPCKTCYPILQALGISDIYWSNADGTFGSSYGEIIELPA